MWICCGWENSSKWEDYLNCTSRDRNWISEWVSDALEFERDQKNDKKQINICQIGLSCSDKINKHERRKADNLFKSLAIVHRFDWITWNIWEHLPRLLKVCKSFWSSSYLLFSFLHNSFSSSTKKHIENCMGIFSASSIVLKLMNHGNGKCLLLNLRKFLIESRIECMRVFWFITSL